MLLAATSHVSAPGVKQTHQAAAMGEISETKPEAVGFSSERLAPGTLDVESLTRALTYQALVNPNK
jgi:hypothetical protein